jgi:hypothetical protein
VVLAGPVGMGDRHGGCRSPTPRARVHPLSHEVRHRSSNRNVIRKRVYLSDASSRFKVRPGLVTVGLVFAIVGAGLVTSFFFLSTNAPIEARTSSISISFLAPNQTEVSPLSAIGSGSGVLTVSWRATSNANVSFWKAEPCSTGTGLCAAPPSIVAWASNVSGEWRGSGAIGTAYLLSVTDVSRGDLSFNATVVESFPGPSSGPTTQTLVLVSIGSVLLLGTGAIGVFLGLFLRGGVYRRLSLEPKGSPGDRHDRVEDGPEKDPYEDPETPR